MEDRAEVALYAKRGISLARGEGVFLWDTDGRRYLDAMSNYGVNVLGHAHPAVNAAVIDQLGRLANCHQSFYNDARETFEETLSGLLPHGLNRVAYANSGTEANEAAMKFAKLASGRQRIVSAHDGYHGRTLGSLSVTGIARYRQGLLPLLDGCDQVPFGDLEALDRALPGAAAVILEPIQGESGVHHAPDGYLIAVRELCGRHGALLILDEVQTGMGRTGTLFAFEKAGVLPDMITVSKGIANGLPMGLTVVSEWVAERVPTGAHGSTFAGNPLVCAAAVATLRSITAGKLLEHVILAGEAFLDGLRTINHPHLREVRGEGLMVAVELRTRVTPCLKALQDLGVLALPAGPRTIRFLPPLIIGEAELRSVVEATAAALESRERAEA